MLSSGTGLKMSEPVCMGRGAGRSLLSTSHSHGSWEHGTCSWFPEVALAL